MSNSSKSPTTNNRQKQPNAASTKKIGLDDLLFIKLLGMGGFGKVVLAEEKATKQLLAVKILRKKAIVSKEDVSSVETEKRILVLSSRHPFLIGMRLSFQTDVGP